MSDDHEEGTALIRATEAVVVERIRAVASNFTASVAVYKAQTTTLDMTAQHAAAVVEMKRAEFAIPEQERTKRSKQQTWRQVITAVAVIVGGSLAVYKPESGGSILGMVVVLGGGLVFGEYFNREKPKPKQHSPGEES